MSFHSHRSTPATAAGFRLAGLVNIAGVLLFSWGFSNDRLSALSPVVFSRFGLVCILLWGLAYWAMARAWRAAPGIVAVFALEKFLYFGTWVSWMTVHRGELPALLSSSPLTGVFYAIYGPTDLVFGLFFAAVYWRSRRA